MCCWVDLYVGDVLCMCLGELFLLYCSLFTILDGLMCMYGYVLCMRVDEFCCSITVFIASEAIGELFVPVDDIVLLG